MVKGIVFVFGAIILLAFAVMGVGMLWGLGILFLRWLHKAPEEKAQRPPLRKDR